MNDDFAIAKAQSERDVFVILFEKHKDELIAQGMNEEEADEIASIEVRRMIRAMP